MPRDTADPKLDLLNRIKDEWHAHTQRHRARGGWGTFRGIASVLQVAGTFVLLMGFAAQSTPLGAAFQASEWSARLLLSPSELIALAVLVVPEWLDILFFGIADRTLRTCGLLKDPVRYDPEPLGASAGSLQVLWLAQVLGRFTNLAAHTVLAAILSTAVIFVVRSLWRGVEPLI